MVELAGFKDNSHLSPGMRQYMDVKDKHPDCLVLFRMGDFYETFYEDAKTASKELEITLTARGQGERRAPLAGIPYHALEPYLAKLVKKGYKVAIVEQLEDPKKAKGLVKRGVVRIVTPGTIIEDSMLEAGSNNFIMSLFPHGDEFAISLCDISTGEFLTTEYSDISKLSTIISKYSPTECIIPLSLSVNKELIDQIQNNKAYVNTYDDMHFRKDQAQNTLLNHFKTVNMEGFGLNNDSLSINSSGALLAYLLETQKNDLTHINKLAKIIHGSRMELDSATMRNLELIKNIRDESNKATLLSVLDKTVTAMGSRLLRKWLKEPLCKVEEIEERHNAVEQLLDNTIVRNEITSLLKSMSDMERLISRINYGTANARDLLSLNNSLLILPKLKEELSKLSSPLLEKTNRLEDLSHLSDLITRTIVDEPPVSVREGNMIRSEYNEELKKLHDIKKNGKQIIVDIENREKEKTGIKNLKIGFNNVFGYFLEISKSNYHLIPDNYIRKQTRVNSERFVTEELKEQESLILGAQEKIHALEYNLFQEIIKKIAEKTTVIQQAAISIATVDTLTSFATIAANNNYTRPTIDDSDKLSLTDSRHPVIEQLEQDFVPNNIALDLNEMMIITGPNMAGKSTYMRQIALIVVMAQIGSFVPASNATIGIVDRIFTRVGAHDDLTSGQSTFMVEMNETANILNNATHKSLIILDEIGRGTSTYDGVSIAWSVAEHIYNEIKAKTLFATHYHVMNKLADKFEKIKNYNIAVKETDDSIIFLRKIIEGGTDNSYGIQVAKLAGLPKQVIERAKEVQSLLASEDEMLKKIPSTKESQTQL